jgi:hypothetical protein
MARRAAARGDLRAGVRFAVFRAREGAAFRFGAAREVDVFFRVFFLAMGRHPAGCRAAAEALFEAR